MTTAILTIILFCVMIFPHELGHFIAAKKCGVKVNEFAFGMGPAIWKKQGKETLYSIRLLPIGGFCAMEGEDGEPDEETKAENEKTYGKYDSERAFVNKKPWQKLIILAAGSFMNLVCAAVIMSVILGIGGFTTNVIGEITAGGAADQAGLLAGDEIVAVDEHEVDSWNDLSEFMPDEDKVFDMTVLRDGEEITVSLDPEIQYLNTETGEILTAEQAKDETLPVMERYVVGITSKISHNPVTAIKGGIQSTWEMLKMMFDTVGMLFSGEAGADDLSGPVGMVQMVDQTKSLGWWYYGYLTALICVNLAVINMLPLPALDGGRIIFVLFTMITGKKVNDRVEGTVHAIGIILLLALMAYVAFNDITRIFF